MSGHYQTMGEALPSDDRNNFLVTGKTGNGKSSLCNAILGQDKFAVGKSMKSTTEASSYGDVIVQGATVRVVDTPDFENSDMTTAEKREEISQWKKFATALPTLILLAVRCDVRYTAEEYDIYKAIRQLWGGNSFCQRLVVVFTFGDRQDGDIKEELKTVCPELKSVLRDADQRYVVFNKKDPGSVQNIRHQLLDIVTQMRTVQTSRRRQMSWTSPVFLVLVALVIMAAVCCIILASLRITVGAIVTGVIGLVLVSALIYSIVTSNKRNALIKI